MSELRKQIAWEAARLMHLREETEYYRAKQRAAQLVCGGWVKPADLPSNREVHDEIQFVARMYQGDPKAQRVREMRVEALRLMKKLRWFHPRLVGSTLTGKIRASSGIDLHVFSESVESVCAVLDAEGLRYDLERRTVRKKTETRVYTRIHVHDRFPITITVYATLLANCVFKSALTRKPIESAHAEVLEDLLRLEYPDLEQNGATLNGAALNTNGGLDRYRVYELLLSPLEKIKQGVKRHPEGDVLFHSLQVFDRARDELPYDEEFLLAALLHDVGKGIDPLDHVRAGLEALEGVITERTKWLIEHHQDAHALREGTLGARARKRLEACEDYDTLMLLAKCDKAGRVRGGEAPELHEAIDYLRDLDRMCGGE